MGLGSSSLRAIVHRLPEVCMRAEEKRETIHLLEGRQRSLEAIMAAFAGDRR